MRHRLLLILLLANLLAACAPSGDAEPTVPVDPADPTPDQGDDSMNGNFEAGPIPDDLDERLVRRDTGPLPPDALVKFQVIGRGKNPSNNYRWILYQDGRWFMAWHSGDTSDWQTPFDTDLPTEPSARLSRRDVNEIENELNDGDFAGHPAYVADPRVEDGSYYVVTARLDDQIHEVIYDGAYTPLVEFLDGIIYEHGP